MRYMPLLSPFTDILSRQPWVKELVGGTAGILNTGSLTPASMFITITL